ncbi:MAG: YggT family protein [Caulobacteraceae bacterium]|nr:YggT family protein [Caulobacteraceae bacterium]
MGSFIYFIVDALLGLLILAVVLNVVLSWLVAFEVVNLRHPFVRQVAVFLDAVSRPVLRPFQRIIPPIGGMDLSPLIAILILQGVRAYLLPWLFSPIISLFRG